MARTRRHQDSKNWYGMMIYLAIGTLGIIYAAFQYTQGSEIGASIALTVVLIVIVFGGVATYPLLFKDSMYLSRSGQRWNPSWWKYVSVGLGVPIVVYFAGSAAAPNAQNFAIAFLLYTVATIGVNVIYLWRRHKYIGRP